MAVSLGTQLTKEFKRAGKKSLVLASLFAVGLCIWVPMLWKTLFRTRDSVAATPASSTIAAKTHIPDSTSEATVTADSPQIDWRRTYRRVETSNLVQALPLDELVRDPFDHDWIREKKKPPASKVEAELAAESDPNRFLVLSATLAGGSGGAAIISDRVYRIGQEVPNEGPIRFVLKDIRPDKVLLERAGTIFELRLKELDQAAKESNDIVQ